VPATSAADPSQPAATAPVVYGDAAYGTGALLAGLDQQGITAMPKVAAPQGHFTKQQFRIDLDQHTVTCPARLKVWIPPARYDGGWPASATPVRSVRGETAIWRSWKASSHRSTRWIMSGAKGCIQWRDHDS
jgi:hypothetical protein